MIGRVIFALIDAVLAVAMAADETVDRARRYARVFRKAPAPLPMVQVPWRPRATMRPPPPEN